jgi:2-polyprenyl-6-hydroxyphenyl methylase / 3-demethylubiquinone-9 3-methyltransferase
MSNIDPEEIKHFEKDAEEWWNKEGPYRTLHDINPIRLQFISDRAKITDHAIIDIGCGAGILSESLAKRGANLTGIDASLRLIEVAKEHAVLNKLNINYVHTTAEDFLINHAESFDVLTCMELLEHVPDPATLIHTTAKLVKPGGRLFFSTINRGLKAYFSAILGAEYLLNLIPKGTHQYENFIQPRELSAELRKAGLEVQEIMGLNYNPFTRKADLVPDVTVNYLIYAKRGG